MKISLLEPLNISKEKIQKLAQPIKDLGYNFVYYNKKTVNPKELAKRTKDSDIVIIDNTPYPEEAFQNATNLKYIVVAFTGVDHVDLKAAKKRNIKVSNAAGYSNHAVSELVIGLTLNIYRKISQENKFIHSKNFSSPYQGKEIFGKTVGIVGVGNIGQTTAKLFKAFGAKLIGYNRSRSSKMKKLGLTYTTLNGLLSQSDIITVHLPSNKDTYHFLNKKRLEKIKKTAILINCARGPIIDNNFLAQLLNQGKIAGAGLDVYDTEPPLPPDYPLLHAKNVIMTPHLGFLTDEAMIKRAEITFDTVISYLKGRAKNIVLE